MFLKVHRSQCTIVRWTVLLCFHYEEYILLLQQTTRQFGKVLVQYYVHLHLDTSLRRRMYFSSQVLQIQKTISLKDTNFCGVRMYFSGWPIKIITYLRGINFREFYLNFENHWFVKIDPRSKIRFFDIAKVNPFFAIEKVVFADIYFHKIRTN